MKLAKLSLCLSSVALITGGCAMTSEIGAPASGKPFMRVQTCTPSTCNPLVDVTTDADGCHVSLSWDEYDVPNGPGRDIVFTLTAASGFEFDDPNNTHYKHLHGVELDNKAGKYDADHSDFHVKSYGKSHLEYVWYDDNKKPSKLGQGIDFHIFNTATGEQCIQKDPVIINRGP